VALVTIVIKGSEARVYTPFSEQRRAIIKDLPSRKWDPDKRYWRIPTDLIGVLQTRLEATGDKVTVERPPPPGNNDSRRIQQLEQEVQRLRGQLHQARSTTAAHSSSWAESLLDQCGAELGARVVRALSKVLHPDAGGDSDLQRDLNVARETSRL
jgi:hypothetical protein